MRNLATAERIFASPHTHRGISIETVARRWTEWRRVKNHLLFNLRHAATVLLRTIQIFGSSLAYNKKHKHNKHRWVWSYLLRFLHFHFAFIFRIRFLRPTEKFTSQQGPQPQQQMFLFYVIYSDVSFRLLFRSEHEIGRPSRCHCSGRASFVWRKK